jgi:hypothetical protein
MAFDDWMRILNALLSWRVVILVIIALFWRRIGDVLAQVAAFLGRIKRINAAGLAFDAAPESDQNSASIAETGIKGGETSAVSPASNAPLTSTAPTSAVLARSRLQAEVDDSIRDDPVVKTMTPPDREEAFIRALSDVRIPLAFERIYRLIYGSQINAIFLANRPSGLTEAELRQQFDNARTIYPDIHSKRSFEEWLAWMQNAILLVKQNIGGVDHYLSTIRAQEFLKYMVDFGLQPKIG